jgi:hypothetical protein
MEPPAGHHAHDLPPRPHRPDHLNRTQRSIAIQPFPQPNPPRQGLSPPPGGLLWPTQISEGGLRWPRPRGPLPGGRRGRARPEQALPDTGGTQSAASDGATFTGSDRPHQPYRPPEHPGRNEPTRGAAACQAPPAAPLPSAAGGATDRPNSGSALRSASPTWPKQHPPGSVSPCATTSLCWAAPGRQSVRLCCCWKASWPARGGP